MSVRVVHADEVAALSPAQVNAAVRSAFEALAAGRAEQPQQQVMPLDRGGDVITYPSALHDAGVFALKVSPYLPQPGGAAVVTAWTLLVSTRTGEPVLLVDAAGLTALRTASTTALAVDLLARPQARTLLVVGAGPLARAHARAVREVRPFEQVLVWSRSGVPAEDVAGAGAQVAPDLAAAVASSDVVCLCTSAAEPVVDLGAVPPGVLVTSISTNAPRAHEVDPSALRLADVYCDWAPSSLATAGELVLAVEAGTWAPQDLRGDLPGLLSGRAAGPSGERPVFFRSVGLGIEDAAVALLVADA